MKVYHDFIANANDCEILDVFSKMDFYSPVVRWDDSAGGEGENRY